MTIEEKIEHKKVVVTYLERQVKFEKLELEHLKQRLKELEEKGEG